MTNFFDFLNKWNEMGGGEIEKVSRYVYTFTSYTKI